MRLNTMSTLEQMQIWRQNNSEGHNDKIRINFVESHIELPSGFQIGVKYLFFAITGSLF